MSVASAKAVFGSLKFSAGSSALWCICSGAGSFESGQVLTSVMQGVVGSAVCPIPIILGGGQVAGSRTGIILKVNVNYISY